mmetsp:Transcript_3704/g.5013  ORF Transcript_3704/g.5013 Transcript_3704/m.5013 type:complete len:413 (+) Transcript_3704:1077-2315(+)
MPKIRCLLCLFPFFSETKRVANHRIKEELGYRLLYPTYREGFPAQIKEENELLQEQEEQGKNIKHETTPLNLLQILPVRVGLGLGIFYVNYALNVLIWTIKSWRKWVSQILFSPRYQNIACILVDNGSLRPEPTITFRSYASKLQSMMEALSSSKTISVYAASARHSNKIPPEELGGKPAEILPDTLVKLLDDSSVVPDLIVCIPIFLGRSKTVTSYIPSCIEKSLAKSRKSVPYLITDTLVTSCGRLDELNNMSSIESLLCNMILRTKGKIQGLGDKGCPVVIVDHGSPTREVNQIRRGLAASLRRKLGDNVTCVIDCSMERRQDKAYDFNEPLLENVFDFGGLQEGPLILAYVFLAPGRHAGKGGDIEEILQVVKSRHPKLEIYQTGLLADEENSEDFLSLLQSRLLSVL